MFFSTHKASNTRFLVAKYIRDMHRLEPRNIGVIVWIDGKISARFLGEQSNRDDVIAPRNLKVRNQEAYHQWIRYWREQMSSPALSLNGNSKRVSCESPEFLDALKKKSKQQFVLVDGGFLSDKVNPNEIDEVVHDLFEALVSDVSEAGELAEEEAVILKKSVAHAFKESGIDNLNGYQTKIPLTFSVESHTLSFTFDFGIYTNRPRALFQHAILTRPTTVNSAAFMFDCIRKSDTQSYRLNKGQCIALVRATQQVMDSPHAPQELEKLKAYGEIIDLSQHDLAVETLRTLASSL